MSTESDALSLLITAAMVALLRLIDAWIVMESGLPLTSLEPRRLEDLDAQAQRLVDQIAEERRLQR